MTVRPGSRKETSCEWAGHRSRGARTGFDAEVGFMHLDREERAGEHQTHRQVPDGDLVLPASVGHARGVVVVPPVAVVSEPLLIVRDGRRLEDQACGGEGERESTLPSLLSRLSALSWLTGHKAKEHDNEHDETRGGSRRNGGEGWHVASTDRRNSNEGYPREGFTTKKKIRREYGLLVHLRRV